MWVSWSAAAAAPAVIAATAAAAARARAAGLPKVAGTTTPGEAVELAASSASRRTNASSGRRTGISARSDPGVTCDLPLGRPAGASAVLQGDRGRGGTSLQDQLWLAPSSPPPPLSSPLSLPLSSPWSSPGPDPGRRPGRRPGPRPGCRHRGCRRCRDRSCRHRGRRRCRDRSCPRRGSRRCPDRSCRTPLSSPWSSPGSSSTGHVLAGLRGGVLGRVLAGLRGRVLRGVLAGLETVVPMRVSTCLGVVLVHRRGVRSRRCGAAALRERARGVAAADRYDGQRAADREHPADLTAEHDFSSGVGIALMSCTCREEVPALHHSKELTMNWAAWVT